MEEVKRPIGIVHNVPNPVGRPPRFSKPEMLWKKFVEYCDWVDENPWQIKSGSQSLASKDAKNSMRQDVQVRQRAYTLYGFCAFAGIHTKWGNFRKSYIDRRGFADVINQIENVVCAQQVDGAIINQFDGSLVARLNGLVDKQQIDLSVEEFKFPKLSESDIEYLREVNGL